MDEIQSEHEFDFSTAERSRYSACLKTAGSNLVIVEPDLAQAFPDSASINAALRSVVEFAQVPAGPCATFESADYKTPRCIANDTQNDRHATCGPSTLV